MASFWCRICIYSSIHSIKLRSWVVPDWSFGPRTEWLSDVPLGLENVWPTHSIALGSSLGLDNAMFIFNVRLLRLNPVVEADSHLKNPMSNFNRCDIPWLELLPYRIHMVAFWQCVPSYLKGLRLMLHAVFIKLEFLMTRGIKLGSRVLADCCYQP